MRVIENAKKLFTLQFQDQLVMTTVVLISKCQSCLTSSAIEAEWGLRANHLRYSLGTALLRSYCVRVSLLSYLRFCSKLEVLELLKKTGRVLQLTVIAGGLLSTPLPPPHPPQGKVEMRYQKARAFHSKASLRCN